MSEHGKPEYIHAMEQAGAMLRDFAPIVATYYKTLRDEGLPKDVALHLTSQTIFAAFRKGPDA